jgi:hypothetical protein
MYENALVSRIHTYALVAITQIYALRTSLVLYLKIYGELDLAID